MALGAPAHGKIMKSSTTVVLVLGLAIIALFWHISEEHGKSNPTTIEPTMKPIEFLYLDGDRALTYLEEIQGGAVKSEEESHKVVTALNAKLQLQGTLESGGFQEDERLLQRSVTPTAASIYMELFSDLKQGRNIKRIHWSRYSLLERIHEGQFVLFSTEALRPPVYLDPYLAVRQDRTLSTLFPMPAHDPIKRREVLAKRAASKLFARQVGMDPHMAFLLKPYKHPHEIQYILPVNYKDFNAEDSLLKDGGGSLTVLGKVARILPEPLEEMERKNGPSYVDFATRETWQRPLRQAPGALLCRSEPRCAVEISREHRPIAQATSHARRTMELALSKQTAVENKGAVVIPIAIYK
jgi:hypothetical protein